MKTTSLFCAVAAAALYPTAEAHSWLDCLNWDTTTDSCKGFPRNWAKNPSTPFAKDVGRDIRPGAQVPAGLKCDQQKESYEAGSYSEQYPMTRANPGETLVARFPAKNHATVGVQRGVQMYFSKTPNGGDDFSHITSKEAWIAKYPKLDFTFSNCSPNEANVDAAICTGEFEIPTDLALGQYTVIWFWEFNEGEYYNTCADIILGSGDPIAPPGGGDPPPTGDGNNPNPGTGTTTPPNNGGGGTTPGNSSPNSSGGSDGGGMSVGLGIAGVTAFMAAGAVLYYRNQAKKSMDMAAYGQHNVINPNASAANINMQYATPAMRMEKMVSDL